MIAQLGQGGNSRFGTEPLITIWENGFRSQALVTRSLDPFPAAAYS